MRQFQCLKVRPRRALNRPRSGLPVKSSTAMQRQRATDPGSPRAVNVRQRVVCGLIEAACPARHCLGCSTVGESASGRSIRPGLRRLRVGRSRPTLRTAVVRTPNTGATFKLLERSSASLRRSSRRLAMAASLRNPPLTPRAFRGPAERHRARSRCADPASADVCNAAIAATPA